MKSNFKPGDLLKTKEAIYFDVYADPFPKGTIVLILSAAMSMTVSMDIWYKCLIKNRKHTLAAQWLEPLNKE